MRYFWPDDPRAYAALVSERKDHQELSLESFVAAEREWLLRLKDELAAIKAELKFRRFFRGLKAGFNPEQPRVPAGNPDGGQWTGPGGGASTPVQADLRNEQVDVLMSELPPDVAVELADPQELLSSMTRFESSTIGVGVVGALSGRITELPNGFSVTDGVVGIVAPDVNSGVVQGARVSVPNYISATVVRSSDGHVRVSFSRNL